MKLTDLCGGVKPSCPQLKSQKIFIEKLFDAAGDKAFISDSYKKAFFNGSKPFNDKQKESFRLKDNLNSLIAFFENSIDDGKVNAVISCFGIPEKGEANKKALSIALAMQMKALIDSDTEEADDVILTEYQIAKVSSDRCSTDSFNKPLYPGDDIYVDSYNNANYQINSHSKIKHTWKLQNRGSQTWIDRKLVYKRGVKDRPEAAPNIITIPETKPNEFVNVSTIFDGRGFDGVTKCMWEMQDKDDDNCFPGRNSLFCITIDAKYKR